VHLVGAGAPVDIGEARRHAASGQSKLLASRVGILAITLLSTVTIARLVPPSEFGLASLAQVVVVFAQVFRDFGVTNAILRKGNIRPEEISMIFWFNVVATFALSLLLLAASPLAAAFFGEPVVAAALSVSVVGFFVGGVALQHRALLLRDLRFGQIAMIDVVGLLVGYLVTLTLALIRHDVWAIVIGAVTQSVVSGGLAIALSRWRPSRPRRSPELWDLLRFGANSTVNSLSVMLSNNFATIVIGRMFDAAALGHYNRAQMLFAMPNTNIIQPITQATMPLLTRLRPHPEQYRSAYLALVGRLSVLLMPMAVTLTLTAVPLVHLLLGSRWHTTGVVLMALAPTLAVMGVGHAVADLFITQDRSREMRNLGLAELVIRIGLITVGAFLGLIETALAFTISTALAVALRVTIAGRKGPVSGKDQVVASLAGLPPGLGAALFAVPLYFLLPDDVVLRAIWIPLGGILGALVGGLLTKRSRDGLSELAIAFGMAGLLRRFRPRPL